MAKHTPKHPTNQPLQLLGQDELLATYADVFLVATENETRMSTLYFFQSEFSVPSLEDGTKLYGRRQKAKCVAKIILSPKSMDLLANALAENRSVVLKTQGKGKD